MDVIDEKLISALRENGRASTAMLARLVGRSRTSIQSRIERLEKQGIITGYGVRLAPEHGLGAVRAHVMIKVGPKEARAVTAALREISQVRLLHSVSGDVDLIAVAVTATVAEMDQVIDRIGALDGVERTTSSIILSTKSDVGPGNVCMGFLEFLRDATRRFSNDFQATLSRAFGIYRTGMLPR
jgi:DNA-binding Lrp family transcriptional regulator